MAPAPDVVLGQGALGTLFAAALSGGDRDVQIVSRRAETAEEIEPTARGRAGTHQARVERVPEVPGEARFVVVAARADEALERARAAEPALVDEGLLVPIQNGLVPLTIAGELGEARVAPGIVGFNARLVEQATVEVTSPGEVTLGALHPDADDRVQALAGALGEPLEVETSENALGAVWSKWCVSCAINGLAVVAGEGVGEITRQREGREALVGVLSECTRVAAAEDVELERVAGPLAPDTLAGDATSGLGGAFRRTVVWLVGRRYRDVTPSSIDALREGRDPELDTLNAEAVARGDEHGVATPWNAATLALAREVVAGKREPATANLGALRERVEG